MNLELDESQRILQQRFASACEGIAARAGQADHTGELPRANWQDLVDAGYFELVHGSRDGIAIALAMDQLARACASTFWVATISASLFGKLLSEVGTSEQRERWLAPIVAGRAIGCFAATEHGAGCDPGSYQTTLRREGDGFRLVGEKSRISNATVADVAIVLARLDGALCYVVVDLVQPGVRRTELAKLGLQAMSWGTLSFDDVAIASQDVIVDASIDATLRVVEWGQLLQTWCAIGLAEAAFEASRDHALGRCAFGRPIAHLGVVHDRLANMRIELDGARLLALEATWLRAANRPARELVMMAKIHATELAVRITDDALRIFGGWGFARDCVVERLHRDSLANVPAGLPNDRLRELLICPMLGIDPWVYEPFERGDE